ncbi:hypothetical protein PTSG_03825 [Salpingoeca rosetta]|uniref:CAP-Gly domain-containing protein n=1 Tax=Salpingoeca rosetta (strain ATCC 50818 / BSB-021) TaxID=946362 RepID=F2U5H8_SALR5|nr:uncharacterized protein PTSG_03825 [Salpingoeca rosetta]EGD83194.1 hypothetical protein PTSG_03825 [Salpingoeca rosetta]|eukprot:XP_004995558.1 hypothetical protein PTSG_03825 [Salpingoeca rosetta]
MSDAPEPAQPQLHTVEQQQDSDASQTGPVHVTAGNEVHVITAEQDQARKQGPLETTLLEYFQQADQDGDGVLSFEEFAQVFTPEQLGVSLTQEDLKALFDLVDTNGSGTIEYAEFGPRAREALVQKLSASSTTQGDWLEIYSRTEGILYLNKATGEAQYDLPESHTGSEDEIVADAFASHFMSRDPANTGLVDFNTFCIDLQTDQLGLFLTAEEVEAIVQVHPPVDEQGTMNYMTLAPLMRNYVTQLYAGRQPIPGHWVRLVSRHYGTFWLNKMTGSVQSEVPMDVILAAQAAEGGVVPPVVEGSSAADAQRLQELLAEVERLKKQGGDAAAAKQAQDKVAALEEKVKAQEEELAALKEERETLATAQGGDQKELSDALRAKHELEQQLAQTKKKAEADVTSLSKRLTQAEATAAAVTAELNETKAAFEASRQQCEKQEAELKTLKQRTKALSRDSEQIKALQATVDDLNAKLKEAKALGDERAKTLQQARAQIKSLKERTVKADEESTQMDRLREQLHEQRELYRTTKVFLDSKTKVIQQKNEQIRALQERAAALEQQDEKRAQILETLLERTTNLQAQMAEPDPSLALEASPSRRRTLSSSPTGGRTRRGSAGGAHHPPDTNGTLRTPHHQGKTPSRGARRTSRTAQKPMFPPISRGSMASQPLNIDQELKLEEVDAAASHVRVGDRVLVRGPLVDGVVKQYTGVVKYVGRLDSEVIDYNIYAGLKMDDPIGDTDGLFKGKRYFRCPERHGRFVAVGDIISVVASRAPRRRSVRQENKSTTA